VSKLKSNKWIVVSCCSYELAKNIKDNVEWLLQNKKIEFYNGHNDEYNEETKEFHYETKKKHFKNNTHWNTLDMLIYTGTMISGVNFDECNVFDSFIGIYNVKCSSPNFFI
jgi:S-methylmethionine-dependent homocysteine/selenocysteine methylase